MAGKPASSSNPGDKPAAATKPSDAPASAAHLREIAEFLKVMGQVLNNASLYGAEHKRTLDSFMQSFTMLEAVLQLCPRLNLSMANGNLLVDGKSTGVSNPFINVLAAKLDQLSVGGFSLIKGTSIEEYSKLMDLLITSKPVQDGGGFADVLSESGLEHIQAEKVKYELVRDGDVVMEKGEAEKGAADAVATETVQQIMAFLRGDPTSGTDSGQDGEGGGEGGGEGDGVPAAVSQGLADIANRNTEELANLIMEAVSIRQSTPGLSTGETLGDIVVGCLRRTFDGLMKDPSSRTAKGKKTIKRTLMVLEKTILEKLRAMMPEPDPAVDSAISQAVEEMTDDVEIDALSADYAKKAQALEKTQDRMLRYMKTHGDDPEAVKNLEERLSESGLPMTGWRELVVKSEVASASTLPNQQSPPEVGVLAVLLRELNEMMENPKDAKALNDKLAEVDKKVKEVSILTEKRIDELGKVLVEDEAVGDNSESDKAKKLTRRALVHLLAEITQELCQSVSAIHCSVSMTLSGHVGDINEDQREVLMVAADCTHRLDLLLDRLILAVGLPAGLTPDKDLAYHKPIGRA